MNESSQARVWQGSYGLAEEIANGVTHGLGAVLSVVGLVVLLLQARQTPDLWLTVSVSIYGASLIALYLCSTLYHSIPNARAKYWLKLLDHCAIYLLIAGTYTPFLLVNMRGQTGWTLFAIVWGLALTGICLKLIFHHRFKALSVITYLGMGWLMVFAGSELAAKVAPGGVKLIAAGGLVYTLGVVFYLVKKIPYHHAIWHLFVLGGSVCHFLAVLHYVLPVAV